MFLCLVTIVTSIKNVFVPGNYSYLHNKCLNQMFEVIPRRTMPQGLLLLSALFSYAMIALNQLALVSMPTYSTYGSQHYMVKENGSDVIKPCDNHSPPGLYSFELF